MPMFFSLNLCYKMFYVSEFIKNAVDRVDIEGTAQNGPLVRLPFASLFDTLGM